MELLDHSDVLSTTKKLKDDLESTSLQSDDDDHTTSRERLVPSSPSSDLQEEGESVKDSLLGAAEKEGEWRCSPNSWDWKKLLLITTLWWAYFLINGAHSMIAPFFPNQAKAKGSTSALTGVIVSASPFSVFLLSPILGYLLPWMGLKFTLISGLLLFFVSFLLLGFVTYLPSGWLFVSFSILLRMSEGVGSALATTTALALIPGLYPDRISTVMGFFEVGGGLGFVIGPTLGGVLYEYGGFKVPFIVVGTLSLVPIIPSFLLIKPSGHKIQPLSFKMMGKLMTSFIVAMLAMSNVLSVAAISFFIPTLQPFLTKQFHLNAIQVSLVFLAGPLTYMLFAIVVGILSDRLVPRPFIITGFLVYSIGYFFVGPAGFISRPRIWITCVAFGVVGIGAALSITPIYADILNIGKRKLNIDHDSQDMESLTGVVSGIVSSAPSLGEFLGPLIGGFFTQFLSFQNSTVLVSEVLLAEGFLMLGVTLIDVAISRNFTILSHWKNCWTRLKPS